MTLLGKLITIRINKLKLLVIIIIKTLRFKYLMIRIMLYLKKINLNKTVYSVNFQTLEKPQHNLPHPSISKSNLILSSKVETLISVKTRDPVPKTPITYSSS